MPEGKRNIIHQLLEEYDIRTAEDIQDALKDLLGGMIKEMMEAEMDDYLCGWTYWQKRSNCCCFSENGVSALYRASGAEHLEIRSG